MQIIHVVRRYGPVGGMERYVWEISREQAMLGHRIVVVCEQLLAPAPPGIEIHQLGAIRPKPRWISLWRFSRKVEQFLAGYPHEKFVIHSHERLAVHHVSTFHGPPFATVYEKPWWKRISPRIYGQLWLEKRELFSAQLVVPNSPLIAQLLRQYYPCVELSEPIPPGVGESCERPQRQAPLDGGVIGFVGREWKRKGLDFALDIADRLRLARPQLQFLLAGPDTAEIREKLAGRQYVQSLGWSSDSTVYSRFDLLLHPAKAEPYGMVIAEALAARVPVVISDHCGIKSYLLPTQGEVLPLAAGVDSWVQACEKQLARSDRPEPFSRSWRDVACEYLDLYRKIRC